MALVDPAAKEGRMPGSLLLNNHIERRHSLPARRPERYHTYGLMALFFILVEYAQTVKCSYKKRRQGQAVDGARSGLDPRPDALSSARRSGACTRRRHQKPQPAARQSTRAPWPRPVGYGTDDEHGHTAGAIPGRGRLYCLPAERGRRDL